MKNGRPLRLTFTLLDTAHNHSSSAGVRIKNRASRATRNRYTCIVYVYVYISIYIYTYIYTTGCITILNVKILHAQNATCIFTVTIIPSVHSAFEAGTCRHRSNRFWLRASHIDRISQSVWLRCDDTVILHERGSKYSRNIWRFRATRLALGCSEDRARNNW